MQAHCLRLIAGAVYDLYRAGYGHKKAAPVFARGIEQLAIVQSATRGKLGQGGNCTVVEPRESNLLFFIGVSHRRFLVCPQPKSAHQNVE